LIDFPTYSGIRCLMMPYLQGDPESVPDQYAPYRQILSTVYLDPGETGYLTIDESPVSAGTAHRAYRAKFGRALHTEAGLLDGSYCWGGPCWGGRPFVRLDPTVQILLANNIDATCALWDAVCADTSSDGDIGDRAESYPLEDAIIMRAGEVHQIGIFTPHESLPVETTAIRQFLRIVGSGVHGREPYFTPNPLLGKGASLDQP
jgi:hypothetical protein